MTTPEEAPLDAPRTTRGARVLLEALAHDLPGIEGRGIDPGGRAASGPGEESVSAERHRERRRTLALEALRRLGAMHLRGDHDAVHALWYAHVRGGEVARARTAAGRAGAWLEELGYQLLPHAELVAALRGAARKGAGPDAAAARQRGAAVLERAERTFETITPEGTGGAWLALVRDAVDARAHAYHRTVREIAEARALARAQEKAQKAASLAAKKPAPAPPAPPPGLDPELALALVVRTGVDGYALRATCAASLAAGDFGSVRCVAVDRGLDTGLLVLLALLLAARESADT